MKLIKHYFQEHSLKKAYQKNHRSISMANFDAINTIAILSNPNNLDQIKEIDKVIRHLQTYKKHTFPLLYFDKPIDNPIFTDENDWSKMGKETPVESQSAKKKLILDQFLEQNSDDLVDLSFSPIFTKNKDWSKLCKKNCNWIGKPKQDLNLNRYINKDFDLLVDLSFTKNYSLHYVFNQSKSKLKIMSTNDHSQYFADLSLTTVNPHNKLAFIKEIIHYLTVINKDAQ
ncbi:MAG: hypothetical protein JW857_12095 [Bacteroidales bacterium]|nr:hypothetical protein [Bacteroidales bacterium]